MIARIQICQDALDLLVFHFAHRTVVRMVLHGIAWYCMVLHYLALSCNILHYIELFCTILHYLARKVYTCSQQMNPMIAFDIAVVAQKVKVQCCY